MLTKGDVVKIKSLTNTFGLADPNLKESEKETLKGFFIVEKVDEKRKHEDGSEVIILDGIGYLWHKDDLEVMLKKGESGTI